MNMLENQFTKIHDVLIDIAKEVEKKVSDKYSIEIGYMDIDENLIDVNLLINNSKYYFDTKEINETITFKDDVVSLLQKEINDIITTENEEYEQRKKILQGFEDLLHELKE